MHSRFLDLSNMAVVSQQRHNNSRTTPTRVSKYNSRRGVPIVGRLQRLETHARHNPANKSALGSSRNRPFCLSANQPTPSLCELEARPRSRGDRCLLSKLVPTQRLCIPAIRTDRALPQTGHSSTSSKSCYSYPGLGNAILVPSASGTVCGPTATPPTQPQPADQGPGTTPLTRPCFSRVACLSQQFEANNISQEAKTLLLRAWRKSTAACFDSAWKQWVSWCLSKQINPVSAPLNAIIEYLTYLFHLGREYRTINLHRSAISKTHPPPLLTL